MCRQMMSSMNDVDDDDDDDDDEEPQRSSLAELKAKGKKKAIVPINRVNASAGCEYTHCFKRVVNVCCV